VQPEAFNIVPDNLLDKIYADLVRRFQEFTATMIVFAKNASELNQKHSAGEKIMADITLVISKREMDTLFLMIHRLNRHKARYP
jgi:hypothetical protein